jgi:membrane protein YdbS with pleckstrin-like domain
MMTADEPAAPTPEPPDSLWEPLPLPDVNPFEDSRFTPLDPRTTKVWRLSIAFSGGIFLSVLVILGIVFSFFASVVARILWGVAGAFFLLFLWQYVWYTPRAYLSWGYRVDDRVLEIRKGILDKTLSLLPLSRLQHVDIQRGPVERKFGLATLILHTAGTHHATLTLPGLDVDEAVRLRDHLLKAGGDDAV